MLTYINIKALGTPYIEGVLPKGLYRMAYAWRVRPFWQDTLDIRISGSSRWLQMSYHLFGTRASAAISMT